MTGIVHQKACSICGAVQPLSEYYKRKRNADGLSTWCRTCHGVKTSGRPPTRRIVGARTDTEGRRICSKCGTAKDLTDEHWHRSPRSLQGFSTICRLCMSAYYHASAAVHRASGNHGPATKVCSACKNELPRTAFYQDLNKKNGLSAYCKECTLLRTSAYQRAHPEKQREYGRRYSRANPEKIAEYNGRARARRRGAVDDGTVTALEIERLNARQHGKCFYCGKRRKLTVDHFWPLSRGGEHAASNIVLACKSCNDRKSTRNPLDFIKELHT